MSGSTPISACIIAYDEEDRIGDCVKSLSFCEEVLVVDSQSRDRTREIAEQEGARVVVNHPFPGHVQQKQFAVELAKHDWILSLDADERVTDALREEIEAVRREGLRPGGYELVRLNHYLGRIVRHGLFGPERKIRLFDRRHAAWGGTNPHDRVEIADGSEMHALRGAIEHLSYRDFAHHRRTLKGFAGIAAEAMFDSGRRTSPIDWLARPPAASFKSLVLRLGFLDGWRGFVIAWMAGYYNWLKYRDLGRLWKDAGPA